MLYKQNNVWVCFVSILVEITLVILLCQPHGDGVHQEHEPVVGGRWITSVCLLRFRDITPTPYNIISH